jgi:Cu(I)-responsive transcriptional regulator
MDSAAHGILHWVHGSSRFLGPSHDGKVKRYLPGGELEHWTDREDVRHFRQVIRYYEAIGLLPAAARRESGYRDYSHTDVQRLRFVRRSRELGFSMERVRELLALWSDRTKDNEEVRKVARAHMLELKKQAAKLEAMISTLEHLVRSCRGNKREQCPIIADLGDGATHDPIAQAGRKALQSTGRT